MSVESFEALFRIDGIESLCALDCNVVRDPGTRWEPAGGTIDYIGLYVNGAPKDFNEPKWAAIAQRVIDSQRNRNRRAA